MSMQDDFFNAIAMEAADAAKGNADSVTRIGTIDPAWVSGRPRVLFDGELSLTGITQTYPYLASYTPVASHRVLLIKSGGTWVIMGRII